MTNSFDPLSFFTAEEFKDEELQLVPQDSGIKVESINFIISENDTKNGLNPNKSSDTNFEYENTGEDDDFEIIHVLDLPPLTKSLPIPVLTTILKLLQPVEELNFGSSSQPVTITTRTEGKSLEQILESKQVDMNEYLESQTWLSNNGYIRLAKNLCYIYFSPNFFQYLNQILASRFSADDNILKLTSLRISENCGRTAKPNFHRKIKLKNYPTPISLFEPALTSDNLGLKTWGSSLILSELIVDNHESLIKEPVLELGSGTGLCGITIDLLGYDVIFTDLPEILPNLMKNKELNGCRADCEVLDWTDWSSFVEAKGDRKFQTIVVADPIYSSDHPVYVVNTLKNFLARNSEARVLLQIPIRQSFENERNKLWCLLDENNFRVVDDKIIDGFDDFGKQQFIYKEIRWNLTQ